MATDTCEHLAVGPLFLTHTQPTVYFHLQAAQNHIFHSGWMQRKLVIFHADDYSLRISLCESSPHVFAQTIPPAAWRPPGHHQSGPGVKIILSLVWRRTLVEGLTRQEGGLSRT